MNDHKYNQNSSPELHTVRITKTHDDRGVNWYAEMVIKLDSEEFGRVFSALS